MQQKKYLLNLAGEFRVCAELLKRGFFANVTMGNFKSVDIQIVTEEKKAILVEVKSTESNRFVTSFFQKYKTKETYHPDFWVLIKLSKEEDRFFVLSHEEMAKVQSIRNMGDIEFDWDNNASFASKGVDNVLLKHIEEYENQWNKINNFKDLNEK